MGLLKVFASPPPSSSSPVAHLEEHVGSTHGSDLPGVVDETGIALGGPVKFPDGDGAETLEELLPHLRPETVAQGHAHPVFPVIGALWGDKGKDHLGVCPYGIAVFSPPPWGGFGVGGDLTLGVLQR